MHDGFQIIVEQKNWKFNLLLLEWLGPSYTNKQVIIELFCTLCYKQSEIQSASVSSLHWILYVENNVDC